MMIKIWNFLIWKIAFGQHIGSTQGPHLFNTQNPSFQHQKTLVSPPSVPHQKLLSSTSKTPQFNTKTPQFHTPLSSSPVQCVELMGFWVGTEECVELKVFGVQLSCVWNRGVFCVELRDFGGWGRGTQKTLFHQVLNSSIRCLIKNQERSWSDFLVT